NDIEGRPGAPPGLRFHPAVRNRPPRARTETPGSSEIPSASLLSHSSITKHPDVRADASSTGCLIASAKVPGFRLVERRRLRGAESNRRFDLLSGPREEPSPPSP